MDERIPAYLGQRLVSCYGMETAGVIEDGYRACRPVTLRVNTLAASQDEIRAALDAAGIVWKSVPWYSDALILPEAREADVEILPMYAEGKIYLQSLSSMVPPVILKPQPGEAVLDMAAAPGGKTTQMAALSGGKAQITACERDARRAERLKYNLKMQHVTALVMQKDARDLDDMFRFDRILLDAPCTGSGTIELREGAASRRMTPEWVQKTVKTQKALISKAVRLLKKGGEMVYSTCSILPEENEEVLKAALAGGSMELTAIPEDFTGHFPTLPSRIPGTLLIRPDSLFEGFFVAMLRKVR